jgi:hypothetical protein
VCDRVPYNDLGSDWLNRLRPEQHARPLVHQLHARGYSVTINDAA